MIEQKIERLGEYRTRRRYFGLGRRALQERVIFVETHICEYSGWAYKTERTAWIFPEDWLL